MDTTTQLVLVLMIVVLGSTLTVVGVMLFIVLKDFRESIKKLNLILDDVDTLTSKLSSGSVLIDESLMGLKSAIDTIKNQAASPIGSIFGVFNLIKSMWGDDGKKGGDSYG